MTFAAASRPDRDHVEAAMRLTFGGDAIALAEFIEAHYPSRVTTHRA
jgi:hypothetical protein